MDSATSRTHDEMLDRLAEIIPDVLEEEKQKEKKKKKQKQPDSRWGTLRSMIDHYMKDNAKENQAYNSPLVRGYKMSRHPGTNGTEISIFNKKIKRRKKNKKANAARGLNIKNIKRLKRAS